MHEVRFVVIFVTARDAWAVCVAVSGLGGSVCAPRRVVIGGQCGNTISSPVDRLFSFSPLSLESTSSGRDLVSHLLPLNPAHDTILTITTTSGKTVNIPPNKALAVSRHA